MCNETGNGKKGIENKTYEELESILNASVGSIQRYRVNPFIRNFLITDGVKYFADEAKAYWLCDIVASYVPFLSKIDDSFFMVNLSVNKHEDIEGIFNISQEIDYEINILVDQEIPYVDLPTGEYKFYLYRNINPRGEENFIMLCKSEY